MFTGARQEMTKVINFSYHSEEENKTYTGTFICKRLSIRDKVNIRVRKSELSKGLYYDPDNPGVGLDEFTDSFNSMLAYLEFSIIEAPDWWNLDALEDLELVYSLFQEVSSFQDQFRGRKNAAGGANPNRVSSGNSQEEATRTNRPGDVGEVVVQEVSSSLEP